jgi:truncated hemoglobin YjbI
MAEWSHSNRKGPLAPNPALWEALGRGPRLREILEKFYARVYGDPRLAPFFHGVTQDRAVDKQYGFLAEIFTGERMYFGDRPRNAHHWMVISNELFDYREQLFEACLRTEGLAEEHVAAWLAVHETFRKQIVKDTPFPRRMAGVEMPLDGWQQETLAAGALCDGCQGELSIGTVVTYHRRRGTTFCSRCRPAEAR